jgi:hypothetical protein
LFENNNRYILQAYANVSVPINGKASPEFTFENHREAPLNYPT